MTGRLSFYRFLTRFIPETRLFAFKASVLRWCGATVGKNVRVCSSATILGSSALSIGDDVWIGPSVFLSATGTAELKIGSRVDIAPRVMILTGTHEVEKGGPRAAGRGLSKSVTIGDGCWLGAASIVLPGVVLLDRTVVAAGSVVNRSSEIPCQLLAGVPASVKKSYNR